MNELEEKIKNETIGKIFLGALFFIMAFSFNIFVTYYLWNNIMVTLLGLPVLSWIQVFAVDTFISYLLPLQSKESKGFLESATNSIVKASLFLLMGFIAIQFI